MPTRRSLLLGMMAVLAAAPATGRGQSQDANARALARIDALEAEYGGRLGVAVLDTATGRRLLRRADERFPLCSTFKLLAAAAVLKRVDVGEDRLDRLIPYAPADLLDYAPITKNRVAEGGMPLGDLCAAAIDWSDNTAGNLILRDIGGPAGFTGYARSLGDTLTRLDRTEPTLNTALAGDERDTTSPSAMLADLRAVLLGNALSAASRDRLTQWMIADKVGDKRIRAGLPPGWIAGDKTGAGDNGATNTIAILWPPHRAPLLACVYFVGSTADTEARNGVHTEIGRIIASTM